MSRKTLLHLVILLVICLLGFLSMGFQMVASRVLAAQFGNDIYIWAFLISTFLAAFSVGAILGGWVSGLAGGGHLVGRVVLAGMAIAGFALLALYRDPILALIQETFEDDSQARLVSCFSLFFMPVLALSGFSPLTIDRLARDGVGAGMASGLIYGISTIGNIAGVMITAFVLLANFGISSLLVFWWSVATGVVLLLAWLIRRPKTASTTDPSQ